jgi:uncharacterized protein with LGFP repeats
MSNSFARSSLTSLLCAVLVLVPASAQTQRGTGSADARLRALYTDEWNWRQQEPARGGDQPARAGAGDRFPRVDAASQQARLWMVRREGRTAKEAVQRIAALRRGTPDGRRSSPETQAQREFIDKWTP